MLGLTGGWAGRVVALMQSSVMGWFPAGAGEQIDGPCQHIDLAAVLDQATQSGLFKAELLLVHSERVFDLGADMCLGRFDQILQPAIGGIRESLVFARSHRHPKLRCRPCHLESLGNALVAGIAMQELCSGGEVEHVGSRDDD